MKKLLGILFCFGFLLFAGMTEAKAQTEPVNSELRKEMYVYVGQSTVNSDQLSAKEYKLIDVAQSTDISEQLSAKRHWLSIIKHNKYTNYALRNETRFVLDCPVIYINKRTNRLGYNYPFNYQNIVPKAIWMPYFSI